MPMPMPMPPAITDDQIDNWFTYHTPDADQIPKYLQLRTLGKVLATAIRDNCPPSADTTAAIRKVREAIMAANAAIACGGR